MILLVSPAVPFLLQRNAVAVAYCKEGNGIVKINGSPIELVEPEPLRLKTFEPILLLGRARFENVDIRIRVKGGGYTAQIYAIRQALAKALVAYTQKCTLVPPPCACEMHFARHVDSALPDLRRLVLPSAACQRTQQTKTRPPRTRSSPSCCPTTAPCWWLTLAAASPRSSVVRLPVPAARSLTVKSVWTWRAMSFFVLEWLRLGGWDVVRCARSVAVYGSEGARGLPHSGGIG